MDTTWTTLTFGNLSYPSTILLVAAPARRTEWHHVALRIKNVESKKIETYISIKLFGEKRSKSLQDSETKTIDNDELENKQMEEAVA